MMDCATFKELAASLALDALGPEERAHAEAHLAEPQHDGCLEALSQAVDGVAALGGPLPAPRVWSAIERGVRQAAPARSWGGWLAAAALLAIVVGLVVRPPGRPALVTRLSEAEHALEQRGAALVSAQSDVSRCRDELRVRDDRAREDAVSLLELAGTRLFPLAAQAGQQAQANAIIHTGVHRAFVVAEGLKPVAAHDYELWIAKGKRVVAAGLVHVDEHGRGVVRVDYQKLLDEDGPPDAAMITLEPAGGGPVVRGPTVVIGALHG